MINGLTIEPILAIIEDILRPFARTQVGKSSDENKYKML